MIRSCIVILIFISFAANAQNVYVRDFGATPNSFTDATVAVQKAIESCRSKKQCTLVFDRGRYDFWPDKATSSKYYLSNTSSESEVPLKMQRIGLFFKNLKNISVAGSGAQFVFHGKMIAWVIDSCENIKINDLSVDYERPGMSEMTFKSLTKDSVVAEMHPDSKFAIVGGKIVLYGENWKMDNPHAILVKPDSGLVTYSNWNLFLQSDAKLIAPLTIRFKGDFKKLKAKPGDVMTVRDHYRDYVGIFHNRSKNISLDNLHLHYMHGLGILSQFCENLDYDSVYIEPEKDRQRIMSSSADGMHFSGCKGAISINNCRFNGLHDDPINVHGTYLRVSEVLSSHKIKLRFMHPQTYGFPAFTKGDTISYLHSSTLQSFGAGIIKFAKLISAYEMLVELKNPVPNSLDTTDVLENISYTPTVAIRNSRFERTVSRGTITKTPKKVVIENNVYYRTGMHAILIITDATGWYESGAVKDVTIRNNQFIECGYNSGTENYPVKISARISKTDPGRYVHQNILITGNLFKVYDYPVLSAHSTKGIYFVNNVIDKTNFLSQGMKRAGISLDGCTDVHIEKNSISTPEQLEVSYQNMSTKDFKHTQDIITR